MSCFVVNLMGGPGAGKSTAAAYIFSKLKMMGINAEFITEFAKDKVYEKNYIAIRNQLYIFAEQYYKLNCCKDQVDVIVTDSPIFMSLVYNNEYSSEASMGKTFDKLVVETYNSFDNLTYYINRIADYNPSGRLQKTKEEADLVGEKILKELKKYKIKFKIKDGNIESCEEIVKDIVNKLKEKNLIE